ncbi:PepSY-associated TM helix domain-containing protein [Simiduia curdlanivorans]|uniref:PepSY-associated TM helix domain-containing protein n=1 Tax=Simiduia curdlanivorans TaxID=1492769 RepID=A0ABV8V441_9GAMM|nr:PepSY-associated TM helix domain-containing protein [Simiduia curdlanivorans]MDN3637474.1 PepSY-associated TM helix domain-containing protein [Simiduia curdlanivorans]
MKSFLITLHRWLGLPLGLLFVVTFGTGFITAIDELVKRQTQAQFDRAYNYRATSIQEDAAALEALAQAHQGISRMQLPTPEAPYYQAASRGETWTYPIGNLTQPVHDTREENVFFATVLQLHRNFLLGREGLWGIEGKYLAAWVGLIALALSLLGLWIWWPLRKSFALKDVVPRGLKRKHFYFSHMTSGVIVLLAIVIFSLTGAAITYRSIAQSLFSVEQDANQGNFAVKSVGKSWPAWLLAAYAEMPEGARLTEVRYPRQPKPRAAGERSSPERHTGAKRQQDSAPESKVLLFRFSTADDWFNLARSEVSIDPLSATMVGARQFADFPLREKLYLLLMPLHTGKGLPMSYLVLQLFFSLCGTLMVASGVLSFIAKQRRKAKPRQIKDALIAARA